VPGAAGPLVWVQFAPTAGASETPDVPVGTIVDYITTSAPSGYLTMIGQTVVNGQSLYPALWAIVPASMKSGTSLIMPDTRGRMTVGFDSADPLFDTIGETGGSRHAILVEHNHGGTLNSGGISANHYHNVAGGTGLPDTNHSHGVSIQTGGFSTNHWHSEMVAYNAGGQATLGSGFAGYYANSSGTTGAADRDHSHGVNGNTGTVSAWHAHAFNVNSGYVSVDHSHATVIPMAGVAATNANLPPYIVFAKMIKAVP